MKSIRVGNTDVLDTGVTLAAGAENLEMEIVLGTNVDPRGSGPSLDRAAGQVYQPFLLCAGDVAKKHHEY